MSCTGLRIAAARTDQPTFTRCRNRHDEQNETLDPKCPCVCMQLGIIPFAGVDIAAFEIFKENLLIRYHGDPPPLAILGAGMMSSSIAQFASYPLALVRTRLQVSIVCGQPGRVSMYLCVQFCEHGVP